MTGMRTYKKKEPDALRRAELAKIHCGAKALGLDDETYRAMLMKLTHKDSAAKLGKVSSVAESHPPQILRPTESKKVSVA